jgi:DNA-binding NarL/FixJ family response regulator
LAGAAGYVLKDIKGQGLLDSIRRVARGEVLVDRAVSRRVVETAAASANPLAVLSTRERQVLELIADGMTNRQIGEHLELAEKTVKNYVSGLLTKLGMERRTQAAVYGSQHKQ